MHWPICSLSPDQADQVSPRAPPTHPLHEAGQQGGCVRAERQLVLPPKLQLEELAGILTVEVWEEDFLAEATPQPRVDRHELVNL